MSEMIERVARAIKSKVPQGYGMTDAEAEEYARAAIEAMREPTEAMEFAGHDPLETSVGYVAGEMYFDAEGPFHTWRAMIDSALSEDSP